MTEMIIRVLLLMFSPLGFAIGYLVADTKDRKAIWRYGYNIGREHGRKDTEATKRDKDHIDDCGDGYQVMTGRELIGNLADDAMGEEPFGESYDASGIVPMRQYRAYITDGSLNGEWEEVEA